MTDYSKVRKVIDLLEDAERLWEEFPENTVNEVKRLAEKFNVTDTTVSGDVGALAFLLLTKPDIVSRQEEEESYPTINFVNEV